MHHLPVWWDALQELSEIMAVELAHLLTLVGLVLEIPYSTAQNNKMDVSDTTNGE
jgi:hypothetical protein